MGPKSTSLAGDKLLQAHISGRLSPMDEKRGEGRRRDQKVDFWVSQAGWEAIEKSRGTWTRSEYLRQALSLAFKEGLKGPATGEVNF